MAKQRYIRTSFRTDTYVESLSPKEKLVFLYLLTNESTNLCWIYEITLKRISFETWLAEELISEIMQKFTKDKRVIYINWYVCIINYTKHQVKNPSVLEWIKREITSLPKFLTGELDRLYPDCIQTATDCRTLPYFTLPNLTKPNQTETAPLDDTITAEDITKASEKLENISFKQKARAVETKWNFIIKLRNEKTWRNDMMEQATFNSLLNLIYNLNIEDFSKRVDKFIFIKKFIINAWVDKYLKSKIQRYDITMFLKNINLFATDDKGIIASICEKEYVSKVGGMYSTYCKPVMVQKWDPVPMKDVVPMDPAKAREALDKMRKTFWKK